ncbi:uncharacterized protein BDW47DRAFT_124718 [Aspergillus candidus]|uniref:DUF7730 domain-containing protein n=1 Tax=Aspergillus candidus TaxID=41067 RepID=A0A2I2FEP4_ASPCN|nr:hypothetical protein BDW47DRAFT_124718 [Aspergillus candidus]PLB39080.1 hypothetical protein BDW47DRAFT_124718 [Aspergillus candidus]
MARIKQGVFSWEDVLAHRYQNNKPTALTNLKSQPQQAEAEAETDTQTQTRADRETGDYPSYTPQTQSLLLGKLSPELRLLIWEFVFADLRLHIVQRPNRRMGHVVCPGTAVSCEICQGGLPCPKKGPSGLLALSMVCKQTHIESHHLLYTQPTFEFSTTWSLPYLRLTIAPEHWHAIQAVELRWAFPGHWLPSKDPVKHVYFAAGRTQWIETCRAVAEMRGLRNFTLRVSGAWFCEPAERIPSFLEPLRGMGCSAGGGWKLVLPKQVCYGGEFEGIGRDLLGAYT